MKITIIEISPEEILELVDDNTIEAESFREPTTKEIRQWAREKGLPVSKSGYLPNDVVQLYYSEVIYGG